MGDTEEYFPRGGKKPSVLFKKSSNFLGAPEKSEKKKKRPHKKAEGDDGYLSDEETREIDVSAKNCAVGLSYKTIKQGVLVLGRVKQVAETKVTVMLPCRLIGHMMACHISEPYNNVLEAYVNDQNDKVPELPKMFRPGQYVAVNVLEVQGQSLMLSTMPQHVNGGKQHADIVKGALFQAAVSSAEDHGYVMDIGIKNTTAFLPKNEVNTDLDLDVGMVTWCAVKAVAASPGNSIVTLTTALSYLQAGVLRRKQNTPLLPGTTVDFTVDTPLENGIEGTIFGDTTCYIQRQHVDKVKGKKPALGQKIRARVLYVMPTRNCPFLTMKNIFETTCPDLEAEKLYKEGDIVENAQVLKILGRSVHLKLGRGAVGLLSLRRVQVHEDLDDEDVIAKSYPVGSTHRVRILCYNLSDYLYSVTDEPEVVNEQYFSIHQLSPGDLVPATVRTVSEKVVELSVGRIKGFVPQTHLTETGLFVDPKKAHTSKLTMKKYKVGQAVTARVLRVDTAKQSLALTLKPSLLAEELEPLTSYHQAEIGKAYVGVVRFIQDYLIVSFFNNVRAFIPRWFITQDSSQNIAELFHMGQTVTCTVINVKPGEEKMTASLVTAPFTIDENREVKRISNKRKQNQTDSEETPHKKPKSENGEADPKQKTKNKIENIGKSNMATKMKKSLEQDKEIGESDIKAKKQKKKNNNTESSQENTKTEDSEKDCKNKKIKRADTESLHENNDTEGLEKVSKKKKKKGNDTETSQENIETEDLEKVSKKKKKKRIDTETSQENVEAVDLEKVSKKKKKKRNDTESSQDNIETETTATETKKKNKKRNDTESSQENIVTEDLEKNSNKKKKKRTDTESTQDNVDPEESIKDNQKKKKKHSISAEDSDPIDTDLPEEDLLTPHEQGLLDMSDCTTLKQYKKRTAALFKSINARARRINVIDTKIESLEERGLTLHNKKYHTAMQSEKLQIQERTNKLLEALNTAQEKLKEMGFEKDDSYKEKQKQRKKELVEIEKENKKKAKVEKLIEKSKEVVKDRLNEIKVVDSLEPALDVPSAKDFWSVNTEVTSKTVEGEESSSSDDESNEQPKKKRKKLTVAEKLSKARADEERVRAMELAAIESEARPRSVEQFERSVLANPASSQLWIAYMAFHLQATELEKARAVARKALGAIPFREELEKLNVWLALLNLEQRFGTKESQQKTLEDALQLNDPYKVHSSVLSILADTGKQQELVSLVDLMIRKYKRDPNMYIQCGGACFKMGLVDKARQVMQKAIALLEKKEHVHVLVQFALLERAHGGRERAEALFEQVLAVYPQRVDVTGVYVDMLLKTGDAEQARQVMERMTSQNLPARKMKVLYKKWVEVEEKYGSEAQVENIKQRALEFIEKAKF